MILRYCLGSNGEPSVPSCSNWVLSSTSRPDNPKLVWLSSLAISGRFIREFERDNKPTELFCRDSFPTSTLPPDMHGSRIFRMLDSFLSGPSSTMRPPPFRFQDFAISSSARSASPSSRQPLPQNLPTKVASTPSPDDVNVRLCFFVSVRNATGRRVCGGSIIGSTVWIFAVVVVVWAANGCLGAGFCRSTIGYAGVPKPGDDDSSWSFACRSEPDVKFCLGVAAIESPIVATTVVFLIEHWESKGFGVIVCSMILSSIEGSSISQDCHPFPSVL